MKKLEQDIYETSNGFYYSCSDHPWPSQRTEELLDLAVKKFNELKDTSEYVRIVISHHWCTQGYWVETDPNAKIGEQDKILVEYKKNSDSLELQTP